MIKAKLLHFKLVVFITFCTVFIINCTKLKPEIVNLKKSTTYFIEGTLKNFHPTKIYLNKIIENSIYRIDSTLAINNKFQFKGSVEFPERYALSFNDYSSIIPFILENDSIKIIIDFNNIKNPKISGSELNNEMDNYKVASKKIFKKIEYLFPRFQKARLENDAEQLTILNTEMTLIEEEHLNFTYNFISKNTTSFISAMLLRDQLKLTTIDTLRVLNSYKTLSDEVKKSPDSEIIAFHLSLH